MTEGSKFISSIKEEINNLIEIIDQENLYGKQIPYDFSTDFFDMIRNELLFEKHNKISIYALYTKNVGDKSILIKNKISGQPRFQLQIKKYDDIIFDYIEPKDVLKHRSDAVDLLNMILATIEDRLDIDLYD